MDEKATDAYRRTIQQQRLNSLLMAAEDYQRCKRALAGVDGWDAGDVLNAVVASSHHLDEAVRDCLHAGLTPAQLVSQVPDLPGWLRDELLHYHDDSYWWASRAKPGWMPDSY